MGESREINSYITDLLQNLTSHEGLYLGLGALMTRGGQTSFRLIHDSAG